MTIESNTVDPTTVATPGDTGSILTNSNGVYWKSDDGTTTNWIPLRSPTTTLGDLIYRGVNGDVRLPLGGPDEILSTSAFGPIWVSPPVGVTVGAKGDIQTHDGINPESLGAGDDGDFLIVDSNESVGLKWSNQLQGVLNPVTDWEDITATANTVLLPTGLGAASGTYQNYKIRQVGDTIYINFVFTTNATPGSGASTVFFPLQTPQAEDRLNAGTFTTFAVNYAIDSNASFKTTTAFLSGASGVRIINTGSGSSVLGQDFNASASVYANFSYKAQGLSSGVDAVTRNEILTAATDNYCSGFIPANGLTVFRENYSGCIGVTKIGAGTYRLNYSAMALTNTPSIIANSMDIGSGIICGQDNAFSNTTTQTQVICRNTSNSLTDTNFMYKITKVGDDYNKSRVIVGTFGKCQTKYLSANITSDTNDVSDLRFTGLEIGSRYEVIIHPQVNANTSSDNIDVTGLNNGSIICRYTANVPVGGVDRSSSVCIFTAAGTTFNINATSISSGSNVVGNGTDTATKVTLCTDNREETTEF